ncbi:MAG: hypothetical protein NQ127_01185 [Candidatus Cardinium sp.]|nr:hypothetical protein [Candidatus Cardinium sp.]
MLTCRDADNYFIRRYDYRGNIIETAAVILKNQGKERHGMVDTAIVKIILFTINQYVSRKKWKKHSFPK